MRNRIIESIDSQFELVLGSSSPRRYEIVHDVMGFPFVKLMKPSFEENLNKSNYTNPVDYVCETSYYKALGIVHDLCVVSDDYTRAKLVVCADTVVIDSAGTIYEKPKSKEIQLKNLKKFCYEGAEPLRVITAVTIVNWQGKHSYTIRKPFFEETKLYCDSKVPLTLLEDYVESGEGAQVAGGFKIQGASGVLIKRIDGDYYNVVGLPLNKTFQALCEEAHTH